VLTAATVHDTGMMARANPVCRTACDPWTGERFPAAAPPVTFPNPGSFSFVCLFHPEWGMAGSITVSE
jgi:plastocyanin